MIKNYFLIILLITTFAKAFASNTFVSVSGDSIFIGTPLEIVIFAQIIQNYDIQIGDLSLPDGFYEIKNKLYDTTKLNNKFYLRVTFYISTLNAGEYIFPSINVIYKNRDNNNFFIESITINKINILNPRVDTNLAFLQPYDEIKNQKIITTEYKINNLYFILIISFLFLIIIYFLNKYYKYLKNKNKCNYDYRLRKMLKKINKTDDYLVSSELSKLLRQILINKFNLDYYKISTGELKAELSKHFKYNEIEEIVDIKNKLHEINFNNREIYKQDLILIINKLLRLFNK